MEKNIPVYDFLGIKIINVNFTRTANTEIEYFNVKTYNRDFDAKSKIFSFFIELIIKYEEEEESKFVFAVAFKINDLEWKNKANDDILESLFVSTVFPYIREKVSTITDDSRGRFVLPIIDLRSVSLASGTRFLPYKKG